MDVPAGLWSRLPRAECSGRDSSLTCASHGVTTHRPVINDSNNHGSTSPEYLGLKVLIRIW